jgi:hypothetical protein
MPFPKSLQQPFRPSKLVVGAGWRAFFATYNKALYNLTGNTTQGPTILDLTTGPFNSYTPPAGWTDLGWIKDFKGTVESKIGQVRSGYRGAVRAQYRGQVGESFEMKFREYGRMQYRLATGTNVMNILAASGLAGGTIGPLSASGTLANIAANVTAYSPGPPATLTLASAPGLVQIGVGSYIVADQDYVVGSFGLQGDVGLPIFQGAVTDVDYIRKNSDYVAQVTAINGNVLTLDQPFIGGGSGNPAPNFNPVTGQFASFVAPQMRCEAIKGFAAREGGTYISEWSCLLLCNTIDGAQLVIYYPHVSIQQLNDHADPWTIDNIGTTDEGGMDIDAKFTCLAFDDPEDGETVCAYKAYYVKSNENIGY